MGIVVDGVARAMASAAMAKATAAGGTTGIPIQVSVKASPYLAYGDDTHNDTAAINAAQTYADSIGAELLFPAGKYKVTPGAITIPANMKWVGVGDARITTHESAIYNIMVICHADNIILDNIGFDQTGDSVLTPTGGTGCHILHFNTFNIAEVRRCRFYGYGITQLLTQPSYGYGTRVKVTDCTAYWQKKADAVYDVSVFNIDALQVECLGNKVIATNPGTVVEWMPETAFEIHCPSGAILNNEATRVKNGIIHVQAPMQYASFPDTLINGGTQVLHNRFYKCLTGVSAWGANTISGVITRNLFIDDNYHNAHLGGNGGGLASAFKPTTSIELRDGAVNGGFFRNIRIINNTCEYTATKYISGTNKITFGTNTITTTGPDFTDYTIGDYIKVSGCSTIGANNLTAKRITGVAAKVLTFAAATWTAGAEAAAVTIQIDIDNWLGGSIADTYCGAIKGITQNSIEDVEVFNNTVISWPFAGVTLRGMSGAIHKRVRLYDNKFIDCAYIQPSTATYHGIVNFNGVADVDIQFNKFIKGGVRNKTPLTSIYFGATSVSGVKFLNNDLSTLTAITALYETNDTILKTMVTDVPALIALGCLPNIVASGAGTPLSATTGTVSIVMDGAIKNLVPSGNITLNATGGKVGQGMTLIVTTSGVSSFTVTFGTNFKSIGTLATGTVTAKVFTVSFTYDGTNWNETARTTAM